MKKILIVAEMLEGEVRKATLSAMAMAKTVAAASEGTYDVLVLGDGAEAAGEQMSSYGAEKVITCEIEGGYVCERYAATLEKVVRDGDYTIVVATASAFGKDLLPRVAAKLGAGVASDISGVEVDGEAVVYTRPMYAGNVFGRLKVTSDIAVVTVRQADFEAAAPVDGESDLESVDMEQEEVSSKIRFVGLEQVKSERPELSEADVVVSGGRALKSSENFEKVLEPLVDSLSAAMGASRAACDAGYVSPELQVGQTGKVVAPKLYIAVGISGAIQHLAGMKGSKVIVAINKDKEAPIAQVADYFLAEDLFKAVPELTQAVDQAKADR
ncbi:MAG: electron transfer flavoprotein subunit alpha/FixB family protein [Myxococcota bacterium]